ncbi:MAG: riboflavin synthase [Candidatus Eisenbacteria bacterium]|nr:riboflavin synthase [Candidatus Eisenbacteria bacterium]
MFTGIIEARGRVVRLARRGGSGRLSIRAPFAVELERGESVSVDGVCLTVSGRSGDTFEADALERTMSLTTLGDLVTGDEVNLERALKVGDRMGGHMVTGHVDGVASVQRVTKTANGRDVALRLPRELLRHVAARGSIAVDGASLTVAAVEGDEITVSLIPETLSTTTALRYERGDRVNIETDLVAKYRESIEGRRGPSDADKGTITLDRLKDLGFTE